MLSLISIVLCADRVTMHLVFQAKGAGVSKPNDWFEMLKGEFDYLYEEGQNGSPKMM